MNLNGKNKSKNKSVTFKLKNYNQKRDEILNVFWIIFIKYNL